jgi:hypothetical protein
VRSWLEYERWFGGLDQRSLLGYSVQHFLNNGGQQAYIIRLVHDDAAISTVSIPSQTVGTTLEFSAVNAGEWANNYAISIVHRANSQDSFHISVHRVTADGGEEAPLESFENLSMDPSDRRFVETVVNELSKLIRVELAGSPVGAALPPQETPSPSPRLGSATRGADGTTLDPDTPAFEAALQASGGTGGVNLLEHVDLFNLVCVPGETNPQVIQQLQRLCRDRRAFLIADCAPDATFASLENGPGSQLTGEDAINAAFYFPWINAPDPLQEGRPHVFPPCGFVAGIYARTDTAHGVWKAPAGPHASIMGAHGLRAPLTEDQLGTLNSHAINCLRPSGVSGHVVWGARTLIGQNDRRSEWKYIPVRRTALFIEESLRRGTQWAVFERNDEPLWSRLRHGVDGFMHTLFLQGALQGASAREAYFVKCDQETMTPSEIKQGVVIIQVGFAPLKPAEFLVIRIRQLTWQIDHAPPTNS